MKKCLGCNIFVSNDCQKCLCGFFSFQKIKIDNEGKEIELEGKIIKDIDK